MIYIYLILLTVGEFALFYMIWNLFNILLEQDVIR